MSHWSMSVKTIIYLLILPLSLEFVSPKATRFNYSAVTLNTQCVETERKALVQFKEGLTDPSGRLSSWVGEDCCSWKGVSCHKKTGNVVKLDLRSNGDCALIGGAFADAYGVSCLGGQISTSLLHLKYLNYLDLSMNDFQGIQIPRFLGSLDKLRYLNLSHSSFGGMLPPHLGNLSNLHYLDLSTYLFLGTTRASDLNWLSGLSSLRYLNLGSTYLGKANGWLHAVNSIPFLSELHLRYCKLPNLPLSLRGSNFTSLSVLDLSANDLNSSIPQWLFNISTLFDINLGVNSLQGSINNFMWGNHCNLRYLDLSVNGLSGDVSELLRGLSACSNSSLEGLNLGSNQLTGQLPDSLNSLKYLRSLLVNENFISGPIPASIGRLLFLKELDVSFNLMNGSIPKSLGMLTKLTKLRLYHNSWRGNMSQNTLQGLTVLKDFSISSLNATFVLDVRHEWVPPFSLISIQISNLPLGPRFPPWLETQKDLSSITLSNVSISYSVPNWLWKLSLQIEELDLSHNQIGGVLPNSLDFSYKVDLSFNRFEGPIPLWPNVVCLYLSNNLFSGVVPPTLGLVMSSLIFLDLSGNSLSGNIPSSVSKLKSLVSLDISKNYFTGKIPENWDNLQYLETIDLSKNNLSGEFPGLLCSIPYLEWLKMSSNKLSGELPLSLKNCTTLITFDIGDNGFSGKIPKWIGESLVSLSDLRMRANKFTGDIPKQLCRLSHLNILDLAQNNLSGSIPPCLGNLRGMSIWTSYRSTQSPALRFPYTPELDLVTKGRDYGYTVILDLVKLIDLSSNKLTGKIPEEITNLSTLGTLNLSRNQLTGPIPEKIGGLQGLETLDLSSNHLLGPIPSSMSSITSLSHLNLSFNNLSGPIPTTNQFQTFNDPLIYQGNPELCGPPLSVECHAPNEGKEDEGKDVKGKDGEDEDKYDKIWFYLSPALGFIVGFWAVCGSLVIKKSWRVAYYRFLDKVKDWMYVVITINVARLQRKMGWRRG